MPEESSASVANKILGTALAALSAFGFASLAGAGLLSGAPAFLSAPGIFLLGAFLWAGLFVPLWFAGAALIAFLPGWRPGAVAANAANDGGRRRPQPEHFAAHAQGIQIGLALDHATPAVDDDAVLGANLAADFLFQIAKVAPAMGGDDVGNGHAGKTDDFLIKAHDLPAEQGREPASDGALPGTAIANQN